MMPKEDRLLALLGSIHFLLNYEGTDLKLRKHLFELKIRCEADLQKLKAAGKSA
jgi:hypothetical protein